MLTERYLTATAVIVIVHEEVVEVNFKPGELLGPGSDKSNKKYLCLSCINFMYYYAFCILLLG